MSGKTEATACAKCGAKLIAAREGERANCAACEALAPTIASHVGSWLALGVIGVAMLLIGVVEWWFSRP